MKQLFVLLSAAIMIAGCQHLKETDANEKFDLSAVKAHIDEMNKSYDHRIGNTDTSFFISRYTKDAITMVPGIPALKGRHTIMDHFKSVAAPGSFKVLVGADEVTGNADMVLEVGHFDVQDSTGKSFEKGKFVVAWKQEDGLWKLHREIWNSDATSPGN